ncbi:DNA repair exonuclease, partial [Rubripirellula sp.]
AWPESIELPDNVTLFSKQQTQVMPVERAGRTICRVVGRSSEGCLQLDIPSFQVDASSDLTIGVGYGDFCAADLTDGVINYWALGGRHQRESVEDSELRVAHYCGSTQGRSLQEEGHHGFSLIDVDGDQNIRIQHQDTDEFRYCRIRFDQKEVAAVGSVENLIGEKIYQLQVDHGSRHLLIAWEVVCSDANELGALGDLDKILEWARCEYGQGEPAAWSLSMTLTPPTEYPQEWLNEETILGDFLRVAEKHYHDEKVPLDLTPLTEEHLSIRSPTASKLAEVSSPDRLETLSNATKIGVELLRGGKPDWVQNG